MALASNIAFNSASEEAKVVHHDAHSVGFKSKKSKIEKLSLDPAEVYQDAWIERTKELKMRSKSVSRSESIPKEQSREEKIEHNKSKIEMVSVDPVEVYQIAREIASREKWPKQLKKEKKAEKSRKRTLTCINQRSGIFNGDSRQKKSTKKSTNLRKVWNALEQTRKRSSTHKGMTIFGGTPKKSKNPRSEQERRRSTLKETPVEIWSSDKLISYLSGKRSEVKLEKNEAGPLDRLIVYVNSSSPIDNKWKWIVLSLTLNQVEYECILEVDGTVLKQYTLMIGNKILARGEAKSDEEARKICLGNAFDKFVGTNIIVKSDYTQFRERYDFKSLGETEDKQYLAFKKILESYIRSDSDHNIMLDSLYHDRTRFDKCLRDACIKHGVLLESAFVGDRSRVVFRHRLKPADIFEEATHVGQNIGCYEVVSMGAFA